MTSTSKPLSLEEVKALYLAKLKRISPQQPEGWYQGQLANQPFVKDPTRYGVKP